MISNYLKEYFKERKISQYEIENQTYLEKSQIKSSDKQIKVVIEWQEYQKEHQ